MGYKSYLKIFSSKLLPSGMGTVLAIFTIHFQDWDRDRDRSFSPKRSKDRSSKNSIFFTTLVSVLFWTNWHSIKTHSVSYRGRFYRKREQRHAVCLSLRNSVMQISQQGNECTMASRPFVHHVYGPFSRHSPLEERQKSIIFKQGLFTTFAFLAMTDNFLSISSLHSLKKSPWSFTHSATSAIISFKYVNGGGGAKARVFKLYLHIFVLFWQLSLSLTRSLCDGERSESSMDGRTGGRLRRWIQMPRRKRPAAATSAVSFCSPIPNSQFRDLQNKV